MNKIQTIMELLDCEEISKGIFKSRMTALSDLPIDLSATHENCVLLALAQIFRDIGYKACQKDMRKMFGLD